MLPARPFHLLLAINLFASAFTSAHLNAQSSTEAVQSALVSVTPHDRIVEAVEDSQRISLGDNTLPAALLAYEIGSVDGGMRLDRMILVLKADPMQKAALDVLTEAQQNPDSPLYHQWLTPETYAEHFGVSAADIEQVQNWLERSGFQVEEVAANHQMIIFSGTSAQVESAFDTTMKTYHIGGKSHIANASDPMIPAALAPVVAGVASLDDVFSAPQHTRPIKVTPTYTSRPEYTSGGAHYLSPADYATIYDIGSLYNQAYTGSGQTIAVVGRSGILLSDVRSFRSTFGLPPKDPVTILNGTTDPGTSVTDDVDEAMLDTEWSGAVAKDATVDFVTSASTATSDGVFLSAQYIVNHNLAPVMSVSYGLCESDLGSSANIFFNSLWQQAATEGITVLVSAGCDSSIATPKRGVNGICSTPYSTCVGGTEFNDTADPSLYWANTTGSNGELARSYIPEVVCNESDSSALWSTGGGVSTLYAKPSWQAGKGVPADGKRDVPDVALTAAGHDSYLVGVWGALYGIAGTSAASPSFAGIMAITAQKAGARLGNANPELYHLAAAQSAGGAAVFHGVTSCNNTVLGVTGSSVAARYDQTTGWGSVDADKLVTAWASAATTPTPTPTPNLTLSSSSITLAKTVGAAGAVGSNSSVGPSKAVIMANTTPTPGEPLARGISMTFGGYSIPMYLAPTQMLYPSTTQTTLGSASWGQVSWDGSSATVVINYPSTITSATIQSIQNGNPVNFTPVISGSTLSFLYYGVGQVKIEVNGNVANPIYLFANPLEVNPPLPAEPSVQVVTPGTYTSTIGLTGSNSILYFGPGQYFLNNATPITHLSSNQTIYAADGAFIYGSGALAGVTELIGGTGSNLLVLGRGVFDLSKCPSNTYITAYSISGTTFTAITGVGGASTGNTFVGGETITLFNPPSGLSSLAGTYTVLSNPAPTANQFQFTQSAYTTGSGSGYSNFEAEPNGGGRPSILALSGGSTNLAGQVVDGVIFRDSPSITAQISNSSGFTYNNVKEFGWRVNSDGIDANGSNGTISNSLFRVYDDGISPKSKTPAQTITSLTATNNFLFVQKATAFKIGTETVNNMSGITFQGARISSYNTEAYPLLAMPIYNGGRISNVLVDQIYVDVLNQQLIGAGVVYGISKWANGLGAGPGLLSNVTFSNITSPTVPGTAITLTGYGPNNAATGIAFNPVTINGAAVTIKDVTANSYVTFTVNP